MFNGLRHWIGAGAVTLVLGLATSADAQILERKHEPYYQYMLPISRAFGIEMLDARLRVAEAYTTALNNDLKQQLANMATKDLGRFYGTLQQKNAALATELKTAVDAVVKAINDGQSASALAARAAAGGACLRRRDRPGPAQQFAVQGRSDGFAIGRRGWRFRGFRGSGEVPQPPAVSGRLGRLGTR